MKQDVEQKNHEDITAILKSEGPLSSMETTNRRTEYSVLYVPAQIAHQDDSSVPYGAAMLRAQRRSSNDVISRERHVSSSVVDEIRTGTQCYWQRHIHRTRLGTKEKPIISRVHAIQQVSARSLCERRHAPKACCEAETGLYDADGETIFVILHLHSDLAEAGLLILI